MIVRPMTHDIRKKIVEYKKTKLDIAHLIERVDIRNEDLSSCFISFLEVSGRDISGCNFTGSEISINARKTKAIGCLFIRCKMLPGSCLRSADLRRSNFFECDGGFVDYAYADIRGCNICGANLSFASRKGYKAKVSPNIVELLEKWWDVIPGEPMQDNNSEPDD